MTADADLLRDLRARVLDESEPLEGLLRKCLALGIATGSETLRAWASQELKGYDPSTDEVPTYRKLQLTLVADTVATLPSGIVLAPQQLISRLFAPADVQKLIPESISIVQSIGHVASMVATGETHQTESRNLPAAAFLWNRIRKERGESPLFQRLYYLLPDTALQAILSSVRTALVEMVMDLAKDVPLDQLPSPRQADTVVHLHVGGSQNNYHSNVGTNSGVIGQGPGAVQSQHDRPKGP
ncbi:AbiTii domain-containing protein [Nocardia grenadensis]